MIRESAHLEWLRKRLGSVNFLTGMEVCYCAFEVRDLPDFILPSVKYSDQVSVSCRGVAEASEAEGFNYFLISGYAPRFITFGSE